MQSMMSVNRAGFQTSGVVAPRQANQLAQLSVTGQLAQTQTTDVLGAMPQYRPLPTGIRVGTGQDELLNRGVNVGKAIVEKLDESVNSQLQQGAQEIVSGEAGKVLADLLPDLEHLKDMAEKAERIIRNAKGS
jgi:hypothetical protein